MPPAESGTEYVTLDERCAACVIQGGDEPPCMPDHYLAAEEAQSGFPCPRREWPAPVDGSVLLELVRLGCRPETGHLFREVFDAYFGDDPRSERRRALRLILRAYGDEAVRAALWPKQDQS